MTTLISFALMIAELRRLAANYGILLAMVAGGCGILLVSGWLLVLVELAAEIRGPFSVFNIFAILAMAGLPLTSFLYARRRFAVTPSLFPAALVFAAVAGVYLSIRFGQALT
ncbi:hypothetical protein [Peteryoungia ipomoeae]|uniref:Uncharacterized protein n=1 Tax=Peteryoungia ipomoeae TaxID=1210932 RepID=A0A4S8NZ77_9HYPH|nr:hypothetical protein [Peteryoungia ipomoeae]THV23020.1 hypothetical protein FAA97_10345 [Peteryoungia ipomoeae]